MGCTRKAVSDEAVLRAAGSSLEDGGGEAGSSSFNTVRAVR